MSYDFKITDLIFNYKKLVPNYFCEEMIDLFENNIDIHEQESSFKFKTNKFEQDNYRVFNIFKYLNRPNFKKLTMLTHEYVKIILNDYKKYIKDSGICKNFETIHIEDSEYLRLLRYDKGNYIKDHTDQNSHIRGSISINLNDNYEGGDLRFFGGQHTIKLEKGEGIFFPAEPIWVHGTEPITKGRRYVLNCFLQANSQKLNNAS